MNLTFEPRQPAGPLPWLVLVICLAYLLAGSIGHDPWKSEDTIGIAVAHDFYTGSDWLKPTLAGEAWTETAPLWHWTAAATATLTGAFLPFHDGARLASALFGGLFLLLLALTARRLYDKDAGWGAPLLAVGTLGLLMPLHEAQPASAILATMAGVYWGATLLAERPWRGALVMGVSLAASFLAGGLSGTLPLLILLLVPLLQKRYSAALIAACTGVALAAIWLLLIAQYEPAWGAAWWPHQFSAIEPRLGLTAEHAKFLGWFAWPVLYVAPWAIWRNRQRLTSPDIGIPLLGALSGLVWFLTHETNVSNALPIIPPLILLAATGSARLRRGAANAWDWFGMTTFTITAALVWLGYSALQLGWPPKLAASALRLEPGFVAQFSFLALLVALTATLGWIFILTRLPRSPWRVVSRWAAGLTVFWILLIALWVPWIDYGKTYRPVVASLQQTLPAGAGCIGRLSLGVPQRAVLAYHGGIRTRVDGKDCDWLIIQSGPKEAAPDGWTRVWEGHRPGDRNERLRLYKRNDG
ncbi:MAG: hypothetical protein LBP94_06885 [Zoogloeaceae bacterium]|jgi:4-amino-4-deoxy-L-arabinose transferase-like glycosyltransferase|nr:hypothetical protein [Zoogloeaceae bacterium]